MIAKTPEPLDDTTHLLQAAARGDREAWGQLLERYREPLCRMISFRLDHRLHGRIDASDVVQEAYIDATRRLDEYIQCSAMPFRLWLRFLMGQRLLELHRHHLGAHARDAGREVPLHRGPAPEVSSVVLAVEIVFPDDYQPSRTNQFNGGFEVIETAAAGGSRHIFNRPAGLIHYLEDPGVVLPDAYSFTADDQGSHTFSGGFTLITQDGQTITATDVDDGFSADAVVSVQGGGFPAPGHRRAAEDVDGFFAALAAERSQRGHQHDSLAFWDGWTSTN